jgi:hypothetical protein
MIFRYEQSNEIPKKWAKKQLENIRNFEVPETEPTRWDGRIDASTDTCDPFADNEPAQQASQTNTEVPHKNEEDLAYFKKVKRQVKYSRNHWRIQILAYRRENFPFDESKAPTFVRDALTKLDKYNASLRQQHAFKGREIDEPPSTSSSTSSFVFQNKSQSRLK